ncbi:unnamed protein product [Meloidogyne enterolobii]|uniref:Uncharacterized protein n=2 Tax=Meloidogyne enterolobii TaxID=390850 RepID=A0ACB0XQC4_MELEN|nr:unnamed protein product [Meloidogyne enterolobii]
MSHGSNDSVLEVVKNKLLQTRAEADKAQNEVERLQRLLIEEREKQKLPQQKLQYAEKEANEAKQELVFLRQKIAQEGAAREKARGIIIF